MDGKFVSVVMTDPGATLSMWEGTVSWTDGNGIAIRPMKHLLIQGAKTDLLEDIEPCVRFIPWEQVRYVVIRDKQPEEAT